jgi:predicted NBD/HSP70 family sugar kinase
MEKEVAVGIDVGGTKIEGVLINKQGEVLKRHRVASNVEEGPDEVLKRIARLAHKLTTRKDAKVGISFPGYIHEGVLHNAPNMGGLAGKPLPQLLYKHVKRPVTLENDANCFAVAEQRIGAGKGFENVVGLIVGTGIGAGLVLDGELYKGPHSGAGELNLIRYGDKDIESYAAGPGILKRFYENGGDHDDAARIFQDTSLAARKTVDDTVEALAWLCHTLWIVLDPERIVVGGGVSNAPIIKRINDALVEKGVETCKVVRHKVSDSAGGVGAALLAFERA